MDDPLPKRFFRPLVEWIAKKRFCLVADEVDGPLERIRLAVGETSVLIVVASAHRAQAYEASRFLIDTLKKTVPIWKKETFVDGAVWSDGEPFPEGIAIKSQESTHGS